MIGQNLNKSLEYLFNPKWRIPLHFLFWIAMYLDEALSLVGVTAPLDDPMLSLYSLVIDMALVYTVLYLLIPKLLLNGKILAFALVTFALTIVNSSWSTYLGAIYYPEEFDFSTDFIISFITTITVVGTAAGIKVFKSYVSETQKSIELSQAKLEAELTNLKDQMNPHFLFNALNGIYIKAKKRPEEVPESISLLSDLMRYQLYDCRAETISLKKEVDYIQNFISLEQMRRNNLDVVFKTSGAIEDVSIAPLILQPFVENAFKHGQGLEDNGFIHIHLEAQGNTISYTVENSKPETPTQRLDGGIGLPNVRKRLNFIYPNKHDLEINEQTKTYHVNLKIQLK